jgi:hypothetical protein
MPSLSSHSSLENSPNSPQKRFLEGLKEERKDFSEKWRESNQSYEEYRGVSSSTSLNGYHRGLQGIRAADWSSVSRPPQWSSVSGSMVLGDQLVLAGSRKGAPRSVTELFQAHGIGPDSNTLGDAQTVPFNQAEVSRVNDMLRRASIEGNGSEELSIHITRENGQVICQILWDNKELTKSPLLQAENIKLDSERKSKLRKPEKLTPREKGAIFNRRGHEKKQKFAQQYGVPEKDILWGKVDSIDRDIPLTQDEEGNDQLKISRNEKGHLTICLDGELLLDSGMEVSTMDYLTANPSPQTCTVMITAGTQVIAFTFDKEKKRVLQQKNFISGLAYDQNDYRLEGVRLVEDRFNLMPVGRDLMLFELHREQRPESSRFTTSHQLKAVLREKICLPFPVKAYKGKFPGNHEGEEILLFIGENDEELLVFWQKDQAQLGEVLPVLHWSEDEQGRLWYVPATVDSSTSIPVGTVQLSPGKEHASSLSEMAQIWDQIDSERDREDLLRLFRSLKLLNGMLEESPREGNMEEITKVLERCEKDLQYFSGHYPQITDFAALLFTVEALAQPLQGYNEESFQEAERQRREEALHLRVESLQSEFGDRVAELKTPAESMARILEIKGASERVQAELTTIYRERGQEIPTDHPVLKGRFQLEKLRAQHEEALMGDARAEVTQLGQDLKKWNAEVLEAKELSEGSPILVAVAVFRARLKVLEQIREVSWSSANADFENELWEVTRFDDAEDLNDQSSLREIMEWTHELLKKTHFELTCSQEKKEILFAYRSLRQRARQRLRDVKLSKNIPAAKERLRQNASKLKQRINALEGLRDDQECRGVISTWNQFLDRQCQNREIDLQTQESGERYRRHEICQVDVSEFESEIGQSPSAEHARGLVAPYRALLTGEITLADLLKGPLLTDGYPQSSASLGSLQQSCKRFCEKGGDALTLAERLWKKVSEAYQSKMRQFQHEEEMMDPTDPNRLVFGGASFKVRNAERAKRVASGVADTAPKFRLEKKDGGTFLSVEAYSHPVTFMSQYADLEEHLGWENKEYSRPEILIYLIGKGHLKLRWDSVMTHVDKRDPDTAKEQIGGMLREMLKKKAKKWGFPLDESTIQDTATLIYTIISTGLRSDAEAFGALQCATACKERKLRVEGLTTDHNSIIDGAKDIELDKLLSGDLLWQNEQLKDLRKMNKKMMGLELYLRRELCLEEDASGKSSLYQAVDRSGQFEITPLVEVFLGKLALEFDLFDKKKKILSIFQGDYGFGKTTLLEKIGHFLGMRVCVIDCTKLAGPALTSLNPYLKDLTSIQRKELDRLYAAEKLGGDVLIIFDEAHALGPVKYKEFWISCHPKADGRREAPAAPPSLADSSEYKKHPLRKRFDEMKKYGAVHTGGEIAEGVSEFLVQNTIDYVKGKEGKSGHYEKMATSTGITSRAGKGLNIDDLIDQYSQAFFQSYVQIALSLHPLLSADAAGMTKELMGYSVALHEGGDSAELIKEHGLEGTSLAADPEKLEGAVRNTLRVAEVLVGIYNARKAHIKNPHDPQEPPFTAALSYRALPGIMSSLGQDIYSQEELDKKLAKIQVISSALSENGNGHQAHLNTIRFRVEILGDQSALAEWNKLKREYEGRTLLDSDTPEGVMAAAQVRLVEKVSELPEKIVQSLTTNPDILAALNNPTAPSAEEIARVVSVNIQRAVGSVLVDPDAQAELARAVIQQFKQEIPAGMQPIISALANAFQEKN